ncbi:hypothetical protein T484DRAFT_1630112, partial [Baffinella frigidus]
TGTSINPLLRAWALAKTPEGHRVTLCVPFLDPDDQQKVFPDGAPSFATPSEQRAYIRDWMCENIPSSPSDPEFNIAFYRARYPPPPPSLFGSRGAKWSRDGGGSRDMAILEEPEHLNWYKVHPWKKRFSFVAGIVHTNYLAYRLTDDCIPESVRF